MYSRILVPVDGSLASDRGLAEAIKLAKALHAQLCLVHVINELMPIWVDTAAYAVDIIKLVHEAGEVILEDALEEVRRHEHEAEVRLLESIGGRASDAIVRHAKDWQADLIAMGTHGRRGVTRLVLGSDADNVMRTTPVPVLLVRATSDA